MKKLIIPNFADKSDLFKFLIKNKDLLIMQKKSEMKKADAFSFTPMLADVADTVIKSNTPIAPDELRGLTQLKVQPVINTTNLLDRHKDVHIPGLWKKSLSENKMGMHLREHVMSYDYIISDAKDLKYYAKTYTWADLGYTFVGQTEALVFESIIKRDRNPFMLDQYGKGYVRNHSVGMQYVTMVMCINEDSQGYGAEYEAWQKYYPMIVNKDAADESGYFWAIKEAKMIEGSAVPLGSNWATPTLENNLPKNEPGNHSHEEPRKGTPIDYNYLVNNLKF